MGCEKEEGMLYHFIYIMWLLYMWYFYGIKFLTLILFLFLPETISNTPCYLQDEWTKTTTLSTIKYDQKLRSYLNMSSTSYTHLVDGYISRKKDGNGTVAAQQYISPRVRAAAAAAKKPKPTIEITPTERNNCLPLSKSGASVVAMEGADTVGVREEDGSDESTRLHDETTLPNNSPAIISPALSQVSPTNNTANYTMKKEKTAPVSNNIVGGTSKLDANAVAPKRVYDSQGRPRRLCSTELHSTRPKRKVATAVSEEAIGSSTSVEKKRVWSAGRYHTIPFCSSDGCNSQAINNGVCCRHDGSRKCKHKGCSQWPRKGGLCVEHEGAKVEQYAPPLKMNSGLWSSDEHILFLEGLELHGRNWKKIETVVGSRDFTQVQSHYGSTETVKGI